MYLKEDNFKIKRQIQSQVGEEMFFKRAVNFSVALSILGANLDTTSF